MEVPDTRYVRSGDLMIGYQLFGSGERDLLFTGSAAANVETCWAVPEINHFLGFEGRLGASLRASPSGNGSQPPTARHVGSPQSEFEPSGTTSEIGVGSIRAGQQRKGDP